MGHARSNDPTSATIQYYDENADSFATRTKDIDISPLYDEFLPLLPEGARILDAGCGTGRDSAEFLRRGFAVTAFDASQAMAEMASARIDRPVAHLSFDRMRFEHEFDGVWANASLLHVAKDALAQVFAKLHDALVPDGVLYASFKRGEGEHLREGRFFNDYTEESLAEFAQAQAGWTILKVWRTTDVGQHRAGVEWVHLLARAR
jgi:SAM-dependent methyltransferase